MDTFWARCLSPSASLQAHKLLIMVNVFAHQPGTKPLATSSSTNRAYPYESSASRELSITTVEDLAPQTFLIQNLPTELQIVIFTYAFTNTGSCSNLKPLIYYVLTRPFSAYDRQYAFDRTFHSPCNTLLNFSVGNFVFCYGMG